ncbi:hypothetical protein C6P63_19800 [Burkholderia cenocepacia]|nr:hypothetical protein C6P63_19800 [Burkholderia cenocepacia]RQU98722.1 hypothetical protein DF042_23360 [Burkholderia cenocepacia]
MILTILYGERRTACTARSALHPLRGRTLQVQKPYQEHKFPSKFVWYKLISFDSRAPYGVSPIRTRT